MPRKINPDIEEILQESGDPKKVKNLVSDILGLELLNAPRGNSVQNEIINIVDSMEFDPKGTGDEDDND